MADYYAFSLQPLSEVFAELRSVVCLNGFKLKNQALLVLREWFVQKVQAGVRHILSHKPYVCIGLWLYRDSVSS